MSGVTLPPASVSSYTASFWKYGFRRCERGGKPDGRPNILCFETGLYGISLNIADLTKANFAEFDDSVGYEESLRVESRARMDGLAEENLIVEVSHGEDTYRAVTCAAGTKGGPWPMNNDVRLWEGAQLVQHYAIIGLVLKSSSGGELQCDATLDIVVWPDSLTLNLELSPPEHSSWSGDIGVKLEFKHWKTKQIFSGNWESGRMKVTSLNCNLDDAACTRLQERIDVKVSYAKTQGIPISYDAAFNCYHAKAESYKRKFQGGYKDIRHYDEFRVNVKNDGEDALYVPFLLFLKDPANITGLCPILCTPDGTPTGVPVQTSKNWHYGPMGNYMRAFSLLPVPPGVTTSYLIRISYGFYGSLPSASHANLSLVGYHFRTGQWEQMAIGCFGETMCLDMDMSCVENTITDVRALMVRNGPAGKKWSWTDSGWGGDWLNVQDSSGRKLFPAEVKSAYISHGPCLTEVHYQGYYGTNKEVGLQAKVQTLRTDDYARTFYTLKYDFHTTLNANSENVWLFRMGPARYVVSPKFAYGNSDGLVKEHHVPKGLAHRSFFLERKPLNGDTPLWVSFPGAWFSENPKNFGTGTRHLVIRSFEARIGGKTYANPTMSSNVFQVLGPLKHPNLDMRLTPPQGVTQFNDGDSISMEVEWFTLPRCADDYYGPNQAFRAHLAEKPGSWETAYREATNNDLKVSVNVDGGTVESSYPVRIKPSGSKQLFFRINGGAGAVPLQFVGLDSDNYHLRLKNSEGEWIDFDQSVHGNDYWQTQYNPKEFTYSLTFNIPMDHENFLHGTLLKR